MSLELSHPHPARNRYEWDGFDLESASSLHAMASAVALLGQCRSNSHAVFRQRCFIGAFANIES
eukprot:1047499-Alexandrium_andersonii.AAC.1